MKFLGTEDGKVARTFVVRKTLVSVHMKVRVPRKFCTGRMTWVRKSCRNMLLTMECDHLWRILTYSWKVWCPSLLWNALNFLVNLPLSHLQSQCNFSQSFFLRTHQIFILIRKKRMHPAIRKLTWHPVPSPCRWMAMLEQFATLWEICLGMYMVKKKQETYNWDQLMNINF